MLAYRVCSALGQQVVWHLTQEGRVIHAVHDVDGNRIAECEWDPVAQASAPIREYVWMDGMAVAVVEGGQVFFVRTDHIGRPVFATDATGAKVWEATYLPFGGVRVSTGTAIALRFPGQWYQAESGLHQNWMRDYDPTTGRYLQADPLGLVDGASVYGYAWQSPMLWTDPRGEFVWVPVVTGIAVGAGFALLEELWRNDWRFDCVNWFNVGLGGALGAFGGAFASGASKGLMFAHRLGRSGDTRAFRSAYGIVGRSIQVHHGLVRASGVAGGSLRHYFMFFRPLAQATHRRIHGRWGGLPQFRSAFGDFIGAPQWLQGGAAALGLGALTGIS